MDIFDKIANSYKNKKATFNASQIHPNAVSRREIISDETYTLWQRVGGYWVIERSFGGSYIKGDGSYWRDIESRANSNRPFAFFNYNDDPNEK